LICQLPALLFTHSALHHENMLYFLVQERCQLFQVFSPFS